MEFILEILAPDALTAGTGAIRVAALNHKVIDDTVKLQAVIVAGKRERFKIVDRLRRGVREKAHLDVAVIGFQDADLLALFGRLQLVADLFLIRRRRRFEVIHRDGFLRADDLFRRRRTGSAGCKRNRREQRRAEYADFLHVPFLSCGHFDPRSLCLSFILYQFCAGIKHFAALHENLRKCMFAVFGSYSSL